MAGALVVGLSRVAAPARRRQARCRVPGAGLCQRRDTQPWALTGAARPCHPVPIRSVRTRASAAESTALVMADFCARCLSKVLMPQDLSFRCQRSPSYLFP